MIAHQFDAMMRLLNITYAVVSEDSGVWRYTVIGSDKFQLMRNGRKTKIYSSVEETLPSLVRHSILKLNERKKEDKEKYHGKDRRVG